MELLGVLAAIILIIPPVLAITAFVRVNHLLDQGRTFSPPDLLARVHALELRLNALEKSLGSRDPAGAPPPKPDTPAPVTPRAEVPIPGSVHAAPPSPPTPQRRDVPAEAHVF